MTDQPEVEVQETADSTEVTVTLDKAATRAHLQARLAQARQDAEAFEEESIQRLIKVLEAPEFREYVQAIQAAAEDLVLPSTKLAVLNILRGIQALDRLRAIRNQVAAAKPIQE